MQDRSNTIGFNIDLCATGSREAVYNGLAIEPRSHYMVVGRLSEVVVSEGDRAIDQASVWNRNASN